MSLVAKGYTVSPEELEVTKAVFACAGQVVEVEDHAFNAAMGISGCGPAFTYMYIEALADEIGNNYAVRVASSDGLVQLSSFRSGVLRMSARELREEVEIARKEMGKYFSK